VADADDDEGGGSGLSPVRGRGERTQKREGLEVDSGEANAGFLARRRVAVDEIAVGDDQQDAALEVALVVGVLAEDVVIEHGLLDRDRENLLRSVADRVRELLGILDPADLEHAHADAVVGDPEPDVLAGQPVLLEEEAQRIRERFRLAQLAADDDPSIEILSDDLCDVRVAVVDDLCGGDL
jgi:hypothetical protein